MGLLDDVTNSFRRKLYEAVDRVSDKEAKTDFEDLEDTDLDNDGDTDKTDKYLHKRLGTVAKMDENVLGIDEPYYAEIAVRDARKAVNAVHNDYILRKALQNKELVTYGSNVFATEDQDLFDTLTRVLSDEGIELSSSSTVDEMSTTAGVPGYQTPYAFGDADEDVWGQGGMKKIKKTNRIFKPMGRTDRMESKSSYKSMMSEMYGVQNEAVSYRDYKRDETASPAHKVNKGIQEVNAMLAEIEKIVHNNIRLKTEMGVNSSQFWKKTSGRINKINERIVRISNKLKELSK